MTEVNPNEVRAIHARDQILAGLQESFSHYSKMPTLVSDGYTTTDIKLCGQMDRQFRLNAITYCPEAEKYHLDLWIWLEWFEEFIYCALCAPKDQIPELCSICRKNNSPEFKYFIIPPDARVVKEQVAVRPNIAIGYMICPSCEADSKTVKQRAEELSQQQELSQDE